MYENSLDGWLPVDKLGQILALIFALGIVICMIVGVVGLLKQFKRYLNGLQEVEERRLKKEQEWHDKEDENWRRLNPEYVKRIKELESQIKDNQQVIGTLKFYIWSRDEFLAKFKLGDLYNKDLYEKDGDSYYIIWEARKEKEELYL